MLEMLNLLSLPLEEQFLRILTGQILRKLLHLKENLRKMMTQQI